jgi:hypothetical protein
MHLEKMDKTSAIYDRLMVIREDGSQWTGQDVTDLLSGVYDDYKTYEKIKTNPTLVVYYRDLLSYLVKTYGH